MPDLYASRRLSRAAAELSVRWRGMGRDCSTVAGSLPDEGGSTGRRRGEDCPDRRGERCGGRGGDFMEFAVGVTSVLPAADGTAKR